MRAVSYLSVVQDLRDVAGDWSFKHLYICFRRRLSPVPRDRCGDGEVRRMLQRNMPALLELFKGTGSINWKGLRGQGLGGGQLGHPAQIHTFDAARSAAWSITLCGGALTRFSLFAKIILLALQPGIQG